MIELRLAAARTKGDRIFYWHTDESRCSFRCDVDPDLMRLGPPEPVIVDLVRLATLVYLADRTRPRPQFGWERDVELTLPCSDPDRWNDAADEVADMLFFLSGDNWQVRFTDQPASPRKARARIDDAEVLLYSGGADGQAGAALADADPWLVAVWDQAGVKGLQQQARRALTTLRGGTWPWWSIRLSRRSELELTGTTFLHEGSSRTRSVAYIAYGIAAASLHGHVLVIAENGFLSVNAPLLPERRGALSTRTTHPAFIGALRRVLAGVGINVELRLPFASLTKGEVFAEVARKYDRDRASRLLSATHSCAKPNRRETGVNPMMHCGVCYACLVRRGAFMASGITDQTAYREGDLSGSARVAWLKKHGDDVAAVRAGLARGVAFAEMLALGLPPEVDIEATYEMVQRGLREIQAPTATI